MIFKLRCPLVLCLVFALAADGCSRPAGVRSPSVDDFGDTIAMSGHPARRVVSLNPTTTEIIFAIGAGSRMVGRSHYDSWPDSARLVPDLGSALRPNVEVLLAAHPDLVILYASQDNRDAATRLRHSGIGTLSLKIDGIADFTRATMAIGRLLGDSARAAVVRDSVIRSLQSVAAATKGAPRVSVFFHIWDAPLITIGHGSFLNELVDIAGGRNVYADVSAPSPTVALEDVARRNPDRILAGTLGAATIRSEKKWRIVRAARADDVLIVDTALVGSPSVRLGEAARSLAHLLHPERVR